VAFSVVLDTCALYPAHLRDTLLRQAERGLFRPLWSADILEELARNLVGAGIGSTAVDRLIEEMRFAFPDAEVTGYRSLIEGLSCDPKDRHVLAAAVRADAAAIVTFNVSDFPRASLEPFALDAIDPDTFLLDQLDLAPTSVLDELQQQAAANRREPSTLSGVLEALQRAGVPAFADEVRRRRPRP
jgi:predicted nucleic acid-binding protein